MQEAERPPTSHRDSSIRSYHESLLEGRTSVEEVTRDELSEIEAYGKELNAFITVFGGERGLAMSRARELDARVRRGRKLPLLHGVPATFKDNIFFAGFPTTAASAPFADFVPAVNADIVDTLLGAGCVPMAKTNMHELALGATGSASMNGPVRNPSDPSRISGGSSGGSAVSVARSKHLMISIGSDTGGSVRIPAALCGVCGFKPSIGMISTFGVFPLSATLDHLGIFAKAMPDLTVAFQGGTGGAMPRRRRTTLGVPEGYFTEDMDKQVSKDFWRSVEEIKASDEFRVEAVKVKTGFSRYSRARATIQLREAAWFYEEILRSPTSRAKMHGDVLSLMERGLKIGALEYMHSTLVRLEAIETVARLMNGLDALLMPTCLIVAPRLDDVLGKETGRIRPLLLRNTELFNTCGVPALSLPINREGSLPTALQVVGRRGEDGLVMSIGEVAWGALH